MTKPDRRGEHYQATLSSNWTNGAALPIQAFPQQLFRFEPEVVIHTYAMGASDAAAAVAAFSGRAGRMVLLSSGDVYRAYGGASAGQTRPLTPSLLFAAFSCFSLWFL